MASFRAGISGPLSSPKRFEDIKLEDAGELTRRFGEEEVAAFATLIGDDNPIHLDEAYARTTTFGRCIVHGPLYSGLIGAVLGTICPGPGTLLVRQEYRFLRPVYVGDTVTAAVEVSEIDEAKRAIRLDITCCNQDGAVVLAGWADTRVAR
jgi:acyl dehydratase